ncbi:hypothetical protein [Sphingomonas sp.]|uniref:hypothetical protein n=1 Tax=Sphingomonas sp. TaxID=28214 RepID=UPI0025E70062|nr:hypothetical protein [Sphingomonas sp.]
MLNRRWAGRVDTRHGMAALCVALGGGLLTVLGLATGGCSGTGQVLGTGYAAVLAMQDRNADGVLDRAEVAAMVERAFPPERRTGQRWTALRAWLIESYMARDRDGDGRLTLDELMRGGAVPAPAMAPDNASG